ncbi:MAG TPA: hypothetical protein ENI45_02510, partial [Thermoplasmatales archaeon]|nr:hypothetical protein [Thermoplasmatales archaeon]
MLTLFSPVLTGEEVASLSPVSTLPAAAPLPLWNENDSWEYTITMDIKGNNSEYFTITNGHLLLSVTGLNAENYTLFFSGEIEGEGESAIIGHFELLSSTMEGYLEINRFDFSLKKIHDVIVSGYAKVTPFLFIPYEITINSLNTSDNFPLLMFPLSVGTTWYTPSTTLNVEGEISTSSYTTNIDLVNYSTPLFFFNCTETTVFYVEKHGLNLLVYNVSEELNNTVDLMYSPAVSSIVKLSCKNLPLGNYSLSLETCLTDSSYLQGNDKPVINTVS